MGRQPGSSSLTRPVTSWFRLTVKAGVSDHSATVVATSLLMFTLSTRYCGHLVLAAAQALHRRRPPGTRRGAGAQGARQRGSTIVVAAGAQLTPEEAGGTPRIVVQCVAALFLSFFILEGFDFGVGMLMAPFAHRYGRSGDPPAHGTQAIGPVWDGNEVWLITAGAAIFAAFPAGTPTILRALLICRCWRCSV